jgi:hypothetical protein
VRKEKHADEHPMHDSIRAILIVIDLTVSPGTIWFFWPLGGWGIGIFFHYLNVFVFGEGTTLQEWAMEREPHRHER